MKAGHAYIFLVFVITQICFVSVGYLGQELTAKKYKANAVLDTGLGALGVLRVIERHHLFLQQTAPKNISSRLLKDKIHLGLIELEVGGSDPSIIENSVADQINKMKIMVRRSYASENKRRLKQCEEISRMCAVRGSSAIFEDNLKLEATALELASSKKQKFFTVLNVTGPTIVGIHSLSRSSICLFFSLLGLFFSSVFLFQWRTSIFFK